MIYRREQSAGYLVNWAGRLFASAIERRLTGGNAGPMPVFFALIDGGTLPQKELARLAAVEQPTMANTLNRMERDELVVRRSDPEDGRSVLFTLTKLGRQRAAQAMAAAIEVNAMALSPLTPAEREAFLDMLRRVIAMLDADGT
ncbi:MAG: MarR family transcriptional regulator [Devosia nanyangense]|uniref:MarR family transcriptional regulator n=1 Tax=Devosia nanyangense TaxID=1228055 RepID=A0A933L1I9_9HYPH|nr:MarR family transcriptional regulator [Devosia nanyangense]